MTSPALLMERVMIDPRYPEFVQQMRNAVPIGVLDQADAAAAEALTTMTATARRMGAEHLGLHDVADVPGWLRLSVLDAFAGYLSGQADTCRHNPNSGHPTPVLAAAWRPGLITCQACAFMFKSLSRDADASCDACGRCTAGVEQDDPIWPAMVQLGPLVFQFGTCTDCKPVLASAEVSAQRAKPRGTRGRGRGRGAR